MKKVYWFFNEGEAYYSDQCQKALAENRIMEYPQEENAELLDGMRYYTVLSERDWESIVYRANAEQKDIVNNPETNFPMLVDRVPVPPTRKEELEAELASIEARFDELEYIGTKIATRRGTVEEYAEEIAEMQSLADRKNAIKAELKEIEINERIEAKEYPTRQDARDTVGMLYTHNAINLEQMNRLTTKIDSVYGTK